VEGLATQIWVVTHYFNRSYRKILTGGIETFAMCRLYQRPDQH